MPPALGLKSPSRWGTKAGLEELFGGGAPVKAESRNFMFRYQSTAHWMEVFRTLYGPLNKAFGALDADKQTGLHNELVALMDGLNRSGDSTLVMPGEYLEVVIEKQR